ncbi:hypothetical protein [Methylobacterium durans]|uniref:hypothetical protein n=1 Tax=Methylobacterium durans TaxID=2202825 RepID=UPI0013A54671|nr:hypothetical protein [Methylobacterium durans]
MAREAVLGSLRPGEQGLSFGAGWHHVELTEVPEIWSDQRLESVLMVEVPGGAVKLELELGGAAHVNNLLFLTASIDHRRAKSAIKKIEGLQSAAPFDCQGSVEFTIPSPPSSAKALQVVLNIPRRYRPCSVRASEDSRFLGVLLRQIIIR